MIIKIENISTDVEFTELRTCCCYQLSVVLHSRCVSLRTSLPPDTLHPLTKVLLSFSISLLYC
jgi:hypothetical protein